MKALAKKPGRASGSLTIGFGMVSVPVKVYAGTQESGISRKQFSEAGNPIRYHKVDEVTGEINPVIVKKFQRPDGVLVDLSDEEIDAVMGASNGEAEIVAFLSASQWGEYLPKDVLQVRPQKMADKAFALLMGAMEQTNTFALVKWSLRGSPRYGGLRSDGALVVFYWADEVREAVSLPSVEPSEAEQALAVQLVKQYLADEAPVVRNEAAERVVEYTMAKDGEVPAEGGQAGTVVVSPGDLFAALEASLAEKGQVLA